MMIRGKSIKYSSYKKKNDEKYEIQLEKDIQTLEQHITKHLQEVAEEDIKMLDEKKRIYLRN